MKCGSCSKVTRQNIICTLCFTATCKKCITTSILGGTWIRCYRCQEPFRVQQISVVIKSSHKVLGTIYPLLQVQPSLVAKIISIVRKDLELERSRLISLSNHIRSNPEDRMFSYYFSLTKNREKGSTNILAYTTPRKCTSCVKGSFSTYPMMSTLQEQCRLVILENRLKVQSLPSRLQRYVSGSEYSCAYADLVCDNCGITAPDAYVSKTIDRIRCPSCSYIIQVYNKYHVDVITCRRCNSDFHRWTLRQIKIKDERLKLFLILMDICIDQDRR